jgi:hypothetical protein
VLLLVSGKATCPEFRLLSRGSTSDTGLPIPPGVCPGRCRRRRSLPAKACQYPVGPRTARGAAPTASRVRALAPLAIACRRVRACPLVKGMLILSGKRDLSGRRAGRIRNLIQASGHYRRIKTASVPPCPQSPECCPLCSGRSQSRRCHGPDRPRPPGTANPVPRDGPAGHAPPGSGPGAVGPDVGPSQLS